MISSLLAIELFLNVVHRLMFISVMGLYGYGFLRVSVFMVAVSIFFYFSLLQSLNPCESDLMFVSCCSYITAIMPFLCHTTQLTRYSTSFLSDYQPYYTTTLLHCYTAQFPMLLRFQAKKLPTYQKVLEASAVIVLHMFVLERKEDESESFREGAKLQVTD
ncbi:hypothetical protein B0T20DRAFT_135775 [Sordaria brevicollis]|uniref:Uncharacterized protein n=1 Tax=Sordaria brevicollis TaxID=83679 RepID=A0AAE0PLS1_SORBR|nr:hypothetical protein B0T20DRAFT_135775 [Sordaria brevicollis]